MVTEKKLDNADMVRGSKGLHLGSLYGTKAFLSKHVLWQFLVLWGVTMVFWPEWLSGLELKDFLTKSPMNSADLALETVPHAPMGWLVGGDKNTCDLNEAKLKESIGRIKRTQLDLIGFRYVILDHCWQWPVALEEQGKTREFDTPSPTRVSELARGLSYDPKRYPKGLRPIADELAANGYKLGIHLKLPSCYLAGRTSNGEFSEPVLVTGGTEKAIVDPMQLVRFFDEQGVGMVRLQSCLKSPKDRLEQYYLISRALKAFHDEKQKLSPRAEPLLVSLNDPEALSLLLWSMDVAKLWTFDTTPALEWTQIFTQAHKTLKFSALSGYDHWNDPGPLWPVNASWDWQQFKSQWLLWTFMGSPLFIPIEILDLSDESDWLRLVKNPHLLSIYQDHIALGAQPVVVSTHFEVWAKPLSRPGHRAVLILNKQGLPQKGSLELSALGLSRVSFIKDLETQVHKSLDESEKKFLWNLPAYGAQALFFAGSEVEPAPDHQLAPSEKSKTPSLTDKMPPSMTSATPTGSADERIETFMLPLNRKIPVYQAGIKPMSDAKYIHGIRYSQTLPVTTPSVLRFYVGGRCQRFQSIVGLEDSTNPNAPVNSMSFEVWGDGQRLTASRPLTSKNPVSGVDVRLNGVNYLDLVTLGGGTELHIPSGQWIYPSIQCQMTAVRKAQ